MPSLPAVRTNQALLQVPMGISCRVWGLAQPEVWLLCALKVMGKPAFKLNKS